MLKKIFLTIFALFALFVGFNVVSFRPSLQPQTVVDAAFEDRTFQLVNDQRVKAGLKPLVRNVLLDKSARLKLQDMLDKGYWSHLDPEGNPPWGFFEKAGYQYHFAGENLSNGFTIPDSVVSAWMNSPKHRENILFPEFEDAGIAAGVGKFDLIIMVQHFGSPLSD